ncbi:YafY family transcriptional regulator [Lachnospiraceae bacterium]|nr:YafY family transcriptional regulator [Lachnospiraceae bacterium]
MSESRLFKILYYLLDKGTVTAPELAKKFEVSVRTIYRDIDMLSGAGIPVYTTTGHGGGIHLFDNFVLKKSLLSEQEMQDILIGVQSLSAVQYPDTDGVMSKLKATFQIAESDWIEIDFSRWGSIVEKEKQYFEMLKRSILGRQEIQFLYYNSLGEVSQRRCQPLKMVYKDKAWYLYAYCLKRNDYRLFRISRIKELLVTDQYFKSHSEMKESVFSLMEEMGKPITIELSFPKEVSYRVYDTFEDDVIKWNGQEIRVNVTLPETEWLYSFIMSFGNQISILYPISLKEKIIERYKIALKHFEEDTR